MSLEIWDELRTPPDSALKKISGGRLSGKTDISPQWRWQRMTEYFGPIGEGWKFETLERWVDHGSEGQVMCFVRVALTVRNPEHGEWCDPIEGIGGSMLLEMEKKGLHSNDEGWKMATTDALGTACKYLGLAADVYLGGKVSGGSKYDRPAQPPPRKPSRPSPAPAGKSKAIAVTADEAEAWKAKVYEAWAKDGHDVGRLSNVAAHDVNGFPVYCKGCKGPCWPRHASNTNPKSPEFTCMGHGSEEGQYCPTEDGKTNQEGKPFRLGWWPGEWYGDEHGPFIYRTNANQT
jgi:hypothetical protein